MRIDAAQYGGPCDCGSSHRMETRLCVVASGALAGFRDALACVGLPENLCAVYDTHTYEIPDLIRPTAKQEVILPADHLHADEISTALLREQIRPGIEALVAVGGGTIHDITRFCAKEMDLPFVSVPTAASCDGFCSNVAAMTWHGYKKTWPCRSPDLVVADLDIISAAPWHLTASGIGDMLGKFVALADWKIAHAVTDETICPRIYDMMHQALDRVWQACARIRNGDRDDYESVTYGLLLSGLAMQMLGTSRPASGGEHHISHFIEVEPAILGVHSSALHGEKVGVGTVLASREYHRLARAEEIQTVPYRPVSRERLRQIFGERLLPSCEAENRQDCLSQVTEERLRHVWPEIRRIIAEIPDPDELSQTLKDLGAKETLEDIQVPEQMLPAILDDSPLIRNRLTLMRMRRMISQG